jgi:putative membrane protein
MMDGLGSHGWGMGFGMGWWWIIGIVLVVLIVWLVSRTANKSNPDNTPDKSAHDILKERYARGDIDKAEFEERKKDLM